MANQKNANTVPQSPTDPKPRNWLRWLDDNLEKPILLIGMLSIILIITFQTSYRYIITHLYDGSGAATWTEELARYIFIWISYLAIPLAIKAEATLELTLSTTAYRNVFRGFLGLLLMYASWPLAV
ncbi:hypothetical protein N752_06595 [Desulforamulus aquiferis]|nr:hypothetical protein N752_06595 [Desulforamulus aquiferis]